MKIGNSTGGISLPQEPTTSTASQKTGGSSKAAASPEISLSNISSTLHALETRLASDQAFDAGKVEDIKQAIRSGDFKVNPDVVADKLISSVRDMLGGQKH
jgi:negative regulator of flagellin synthesis FlgM